MSFRDTEIGLLIKLKPKEANALLAAKFASCGGFATDVAASLGVNVATVQRWLLKLASLGFDPRKSAKTPATHYRPREEKPAKRKKKAGSKKKAAA